jgi:methyl-accepting chemotaxis protein
VKRFHRRRRFLILNFQYQLLAVSVLYFLSILLIFVGILFIPSMIQLGSSPLSGKEALEAANQFLSLHSSVWPGILVVFVLLIIHSILVSHRIAGPLYRFRTFFSDIANGQLGKQVRIRKNDYLQEDAQMINEMIGSLRVKITSIQEHHRQARAALGQLSGALEPGSSDEMKQRLEILRNRMEELNADIEHFATAEEAPRFKGESTS